MGEGKYAIGALVRDLAGDKGFIVGKRKGERLVRYSDAMQVWMDKSVLDVLKPPALVGRLVEGGTYLTRSGDTVGPMRKTSDEDYPWTVGSMSFTSKGAWFDDNDEDSGDLVVALEEPEGAEPAKAWVPKVVDRVRFTSECPESWWFGPHTEFTDGTVSESLNDALYAFTVITADGNEAFVDIEHIEPAINTTPAPLTIESGKFYRTRHGLKVGPMMRSGDGMFYWRSPMGQVDAYVSAWGVNGAFYADCEHDNDLIAEWVDEPAEPIAAKFKVGDRVESVSDTCTDIDIGDVFTVTDVYDDNVCFRDSAGDSRNRYKSRYKLSTPSPQESHIVCKLTTNGKPRPNPRPYVHTSLDSATQEAQRLADIHGDDFAVYSRGDVKSVDAGEVPDGFLTEDAKTWLADNNGKRGGLAFPWHDTQQGHGFWESEYFTLGRKGRAILKAWIAASEQQHAPA